MQVTSHDLQNDIAVRIVGDDGQMAVMIAVSMVHDEMKTFSSLANSEDNQCLRPAHTAVEITKRP